MVNVKKVDVLALAAEHPEEFAREYKPEAGLQVSAWIVDGE